LYVSTSFRTVSQLRSTHPGATALDYAVAIGQREIAWIDKYAVPKASDDPLIESTAQNSPSAHIALLEKCLKVVPHLLDADDRLTSSNLWHTGLHHFNVFINQNRITSVTGEAFRQVLCCLKSNRQSP
jgi:hypothetical protein